MRAASIATVFVLVAGNAAAQVGDAGMLPKPNIPYDWHTYVYAAHRWGGIGDVVTARADTWAGQWGGGVSIGLLDSPAGTDHLAVSLVGMRSAIDAGNSFDQFGVQLQAGATVRTGPGETTVDARGSAGLVTRLSPLFLSGQAWIDVDVVGYDLRDRSELRGGAGIGLRLTTHEYIERAGIQLHARFGSGESPALEVGLHYSTG